MIIQKNEHLDFSGSIHGGLGDLLYTFCQAEGLKIPEKLEQIQNCERFTYMVWLNVLKEIEQQSQQPALGLKIAKYVKPKHLGILAYIALSCENLGTALQRYHDLSRLIYDGSPLSVVVLDSFLAIGWNKVPFHQTTQLSNEIAMALTMQFLKHFMAFDDIHLHEVHFTHRAPNQIIIYEQFFRCKIKFSQPLAQILLPLQELQRPLQNGDQTLQNLLMQQAQALLDQLPHSTQLDERLQQEILTGLQKNLYHIEYIASQLNLSVRQLQRHLQQQNTTFQHRVQGIRHLLAEQYLKDPHLGLQEIALLLCYSEQSAFQRAFKQWTTYTPRQWRQKYLEQQWKADEF